MINVTPRRRNEPPDAAERARWAQRLQGLGIPAARIAAWVRAGRSRQAIVDEMRAWLKETPKRQD